MSAAGGRRRRGLGRRRRAHVRVAHAQVDALVVALGRRVDGGALRVALPLRVGRALGLGRRLRRRGRDRRRRRRGRRVEAARRVGHGGVGDGGRAGGGGGGGGALLLLSDDDGDAVGGLRRARVHLVGVPLARRLEPRLLRLHARLRHLEVGLEAREVPLAGVVLVVVGRLRRVVRAELAAAEGAAVEGAARHAALRRLGEVVARRLRHLLTCGGGRRRAAASAAGGGGVGRAVGGGRRRARREADVFVNDRSGGEVALVVGLVVRPLEDDVAGVLARRDDHSLEGRRPPRRDAVGGGAPRAQVAEVEVTARLLLRAGAGGGAA